ncbi:MAG: ATP-binding protein [Akkermansia muciniphila]
MLTPDHFDSQSAELLRSGRPVLAGISGGRDSMALLSLLSGMPGCNLVACHVNHQLRPEAEEEEMFVLRYAASLGIPCVRERVNVRSMAHTRGIAIEEAAREARQASFLKWAAGYPGLSWLWPTTGTTSRKRPFFTSAAVPPAFTACSPSPPGPTD